MGTDMWYAVQDAWYGCGGTVATWSHPVVQEATTYFVRGVMDAITWLQYINLVNSDNLAVGYCILSTVGV